ncbi:hypothetical protein FPQ18DRAFT_106573 [Pyronema domesticum]|nr:hypothetical protein FPQ18DRAFT_106573 [Pyronema domesticum]
MASSSDPQATGCNAGGASHLSPLVNVDDRLTLHDYALHENVLDTDPRFQYDILRDAVCRALFETEPEDESKLKNYLGYYVKECRDETTKSSTSLPPKMERHGHLIATIEFLYHSYGQTRAQIRAGLEEFHEQKIFQGEDDSTKNFAIAFCLRVWLMTNVRGLGDINVIPGVSTLTWDDDNTTLKEFLDKELFGKEGRVEASRAAEDIPQEGFTAFEIQKYEKIKFVMTSNLADHLSFETSDNDRSKTEVYIFPHVYFLHKHATTGKFTEILNPELLQETLHTLSLLFRNVQDVESLKSPVPEDNPIDLVTLQKYYAHEESRNNVSAYAYYGVRLEKLNILFQDTKSLAKRNGLFIRKNHQEVPLRRFSNATIAQATASNGSRSSESKWNIQGPPRPLVLSRLTKSWTPTFTHGYRSRMKRHQRQCPRLDVVTDMGSKQPYGYLLIALFDYHSTAREMKIDFDREDVSEQQLFSEIRRCYHSLYSWRRYIHLKSLSGFRLYCCEGPTFETHTRPSLSEYNYEAEIALAQLFKVYSRRRTWLQYKPDVRTAWVVWIDENLNGGSRDPSRKDCRTLGLELIIEWSGTRIVVFTAILVLFSLIFGILYGELTPNHDRQTSWGVASYIVTVTGGRFIYQHVFMPYANEIDCIKSSLLF